MGRLTPASMPSCVSSATPAPPSTLAGLIEQADTSAEGVLARVRAAVPVLPLIRPGGVAVIGDMATAKLTS